MKEIMIQVPVTSAKDGSTLLKKFPLDKGLYEAIKTLNPEEQVKYFTIYYRDWKHEDNLRKHYGGSLDSPDEFYDFAHDVPDPSLDPSKFCLQLERNELLKKGLMKLTNLQYTIVYKTYFEEKTQLQISNELAITQQAVARILDRALAKLRKTLGDNF